MSNRLSKFQTTKNGSGNDWPFDSKLKFSDNEDTESDESRKSFYPNQQQCDGGRLDTVFFGMFHLLTENVFGSI